MRERCTRMPSKARLIGPPGALGAIDMVLSCGSRGVTEDGSNGGGRQAMRAIQRSAKGNVACKKKKKGKR